MDTKDIDDFSKKYKGSKDEENDLINFYNKTKGNVKLILQEIILS